MNEKIKYYLDIIENNIKDIEEAISNLRKNLDSKKKDINPPSSKSEIEVFSAGHQPKNLVYIKSLKWNANCSKCGKFLKKGWGAYYNPKEKKVYCSKCKNG